MGFLVTAVLIVLGLIVVFAVLKFLFKLAWHLLAAGCVVLLIIAVLVTLGGYLMR